MKQRRVKTPCLLFVMTLSLLLLLPLAETARAEAGKVLVIKGKLTTEKCMSNPECHLEWYENPESLVLFTKKRTIYRLEKGEIPAWKFNSGFGKQVAVKGVIKGRKIIIKDIVPLGGSGKISKSCL